MALKLSIFTTVTSPNKRGDNAFNAIECYSELADEVVVVDGSYQADNPDKKWHDNYIYGRIKRELYEWPREFSWEFIGQQFTRGYEACTGDVVLRADLDFLFHESDFEKIREAAELLLISGQPAMNMIKWQFILPDRYNLKSRLPVLINKRAYGNRIKFDSGGDLCQPSVDGQEIKVSSLPVAKIPIYNYECITKTKQQIKDDKARFARAWHSRFGEWKLGTSETSYEKWFDMIKGRFNKPHRKINLNQHPKYIQDTILNLREDQFGYSGFGLETNSYVRELVSA